MNTEPRKYVIDMLETYQQRMRQIALLQYELEHPVHVSPNEMIEAMSYARGDGGSQSEGHISNKTLYIALNYQEQAHRISFDSTNEIALRLMKMEQEQNRLLYYVSLLDNRQAEVIRLLYFERLTLEKVEDMMGLSAKTLRKLKNAAIDTLAGMYEFAADRR